MTTLAWDGTELAADRASWSGVIKSRVLKVHKRQDRDGRPVLVGLTGDGGWAMAWMEWHFGKGDHPGAYPDKDVKLTVNIALVVDSRRRVWRYSANLQRIRVFGRLHVAGAGQEVALGAMAAGASARRAIRIAIKHSECAGIGVDAVSF